MFQIRKFVMRSVIALLLVACLSVSLTAAKTVLPANALFLVTDNKTHTEVAVQPIDPVTLHDIPDVTAISLEQHYVAALSHDRKTLAAILWPNGYDDKGGVLHLIDLTTWSDQTTSATYDQYVDKLFFSPDNRMLYGLEAVFPAQTFEGSGPDHLSIVRYSITDETQTTLIDLPSSFMPSSEQLLKSGTQMALFGVPTAGFVAKDVPEVILVDLSAKQITATIKLDGLEAGTKPLNNNMPYEMAYENNQPGLAWDLDANLLYVAHAADDRITVVDLMQGTTWEVAYQEGKTAVKSKGIMPGEDRIALLDPMNAEILLSSNHREVHTLDDNTTESSMQPMGIQAIDLGQGQSTRQTNLPLYEMMLSPDGRTILATGTQMEAHENGDWKTMNSGLYILDAFSLRSLNQIKFENNSFTLEGFSADSTMAYTTDFAPDIMNPPTTLRAINLMTFRVSAERTLNGGYTDLFGTENACSP